MLNWKPSPAEVIPVPALMVEKAESFLKIKFITPAMASEPYCEDAPSRSTSTRSMAAIGIAARFTPTSPLPGVRFKYACACWLTRFPLIKTSVLEGPKPRMSAGAKPAVASEIAWSCALNEGMAKVNAR